MLLAAVCISVGFYHYSASGNVIVDEDERGFKIENASLTTYITLSNAEGSVTLIKEGQVWTVNGNHLVDDDKIKLLLQAVSHIEVKRRVSKLKSDSLFSIINSNKISVVIKNGNSLVREFYIGEDLKDSSGVYLLKKGSALPFVGYVLGEKHLFNEVFSTVVNSWKSKEILNIRKNRIKKLSLTYILDTERSFTVETKNNEILFLNMDGNESENKNINALVEYLSKIDRVTAKSIVTSDFKSEHFFDLTIELDNKEVINNKGTQDSLLLMKGYRKHSIFGQRDFSGSLLKYDDEYFILTLNDECYLLDYFSFENILLQHSDFLK